MIRMLKTAAGPDGSWTVGQQYSLSHRLEKALVVCGSAEWVGPEPREAAPAPVETAEAAPEAPEVERAVERADKPSKGRRRG